MSEFCSRLYDSSAFWNAFWVFVGIVSGAVIQHILNLISRRSQKKMALEVLSVELRMNLRECERFFARIKFLKEQIGAREARDDVLYVSFANFDYSALSPLVNSGHFHTVLGDVGPRRISIL